jgi:hypothetical protein
MNRESGERVCDREKAVGVRVCLCVIVDIWVIKYCFIHCNIIQSYRNVPVNQKGYSCFRLGSKIAE